ncbi:MAG: 3'-5' exonuclease [Chloroflexi bacterium]|nr:MAG: 3'-5' exonuclease [Chloroflexota bacterium]
MKERLSQAKTRRQAIQWAQSLLFEDPPAVVVDFETTGVDEQAEIVQAAVINAKGAVVLNTLVKPSQPIPPEAARVHGISDDAVANAPTFVQAYVQLSQALAGTVAVAYNADFDRRILQQTCARYGLPLIKPRRWECAMLNYAAYHGELSHRGGFRWHKLTEAAFQQGIPIENAHDALGDIRMTLALIQKMARGEPYTR